MPSYLSSLGQVEDDPVQHALEVLGQELVRLVQDQQFAVLHVGHLHEHRRCHRIDEILRQLRYHKYSYWIY